VRAGPLIVLVVLGGCGSDGRPAAQGPPAGAELWFVDVAEESGLAFRHQSGAAGRFLLPEIMGGGVGLLDFDGDGALDVYLVQSGRMDAAPDQHAPNRLFRNDGRGRFTEVAGAAGAPGRGYGMGCAAGDYDDDGDVDLYVTNVGPNVLYRNDGGRFADVTDAARVGDPGWSTSAAFVDFDHDGDLDLFVCNYVDWKPTPAFLERRCHGLGGAADYCSPQSYGAPSTSTLYENEGDGTFRDVSAASGIASRRGTALGVVCTDLDGDGRVDLYVANDQMFSFAWMNGGNGTFAERGAELGVAVSETGKSQAGMGVVSVDVDADGDFDLWKVHLYREGHILYLNRQSYFDDVTARFGLLASTRRFTGFGTGVFDADHDGLLDIFVANGRVEVVAGLVETADPYAEPDQILRQRDVGRFVDVSASAGPALRLVETGRGAAFGDLDGDGDVDVVVANRDGPTRLLRNDSPKRGTFLVLRVLDRSGRDAYGARVTVSSAAGAAGPRRYAEVRAASSYLATNDPRLHFGFGPHERTLDRVTVVWPDGTRERFGPFEHGRAAVVRRGSGQPDPPR
jgi:hypothetical protein